MSEKTSYNTPSSQNRRTDRPIEGRIEGKGPAPEFPSRNPGFRVKRKVDHVKMIIAVASGKGGVGKSTVAVNIATTLSQQGYRVGLLDADIYGPSMPKMLKLTEKPHVTDEKKLIPLDAYGMKVMSMGLMAPEESPMIWRGPMVQSAFLQMLFDVAWATKEAPLDFLILDMPPGTGDIQLTLAQQVYVDGAIIVSTPQDIALIDARKGLHMFQKVDIPILGLVENMSTFECPHCHHETPIFGQGGAEAEAQKLNVPFLGAIPLDLELRKSSDEGIPAALTSSSIKEKYDTVIKKMINQLIKP